MTMADGQAVHLDPVQLLHPDQVEAVNGTVDEKQPHYVIINTAIPIPADNDKSETEQPKHVCPECHKPHFDEGVWAIRPHSTHKCIDDRVGKGCGHTWATEPVVDRAEYDRAVQQDCAALEQSTCSTGAPPTPHPPSTQTLGKRGTPVLQRSPWPQVLVRPGMPWTVTAAWAVLWCVAILFAGFVVAVLTRGHHP